MNMAFKGKTVLNVILFIGVVLVGIFCIFGRFEKLDYTVDDLALVELSINGDFEPVVVTEKSDIETLLVSINGSRAALPRIALPTGGWNFYAITFSFQDGHEEIFKFIPNAWDAEARTSKMQRVGAGLPSRFQGDLEYVFYDLVKKHGPTDKNMEWYEAFYEKVEKKSS